MTLAEARSRIFADLSSCPVCGAAQFAAEKSDVFESLTFRCTAAFFVETGGQFAVSQECPRPSYVAIRHLERQAEDLARKAVA